MCSAHTGELWRTGDTLTVLNGAYAERSGVIVRFKHYSPCFAGVVLRFDDGEEHSFNPYNVKKVRDGRTV